MAKASAYQECECFYWISELPSNHSLILKLRLSKFCVSASKILGLFGLWVCSTFTISFRQYIVAISLQHTAFGMILVYLARLVFHLQFICWNHSVCRSHISLWQFDMTGTQHHRKGTASDARVVLPHGAFEGLSHGSKMVCHLPYGVAFRLCRQWKTTDSIESMRDLINRVIHHYTTGRHTVRNIPVTWCLKFSSPFPNAGCNFQEARQICCVRGYFERELMAPYYSGAKTHNEFPTLSLDCYMCDKYIENNSFSCWQLPFSKRPETRISMTSSPRTLSVFLTRWMTLVSRESVDTFEISMGWDTLRKV